MVNDATRSNNKKSTLCRFHFIATGVFLVALLVNSVFFPGSQICGPVFTHGDRHGDEVALTFDDGPHEPYTTEVLKILKAKKAKATFFLVGKNAERYPETVREEVSEGMEIGNHTFSHSNMIRRKSPIVIEELESTQQIIKMISGVEPVWFRPPHGFRDPKLFRNTRRCDLAVAEWSKMSRDWTCPGVDAIIHRSLHGLKAGDIILLHDGNGSNISGDRSQTVEALPAIIDGVRSKGFRLVTLSELARGGGRGLKDFRRFTEEEPSGADFAVVSR